MLRDLNTIKATVQKFFKSKGKNIELKFRGNHLLIEITVINGNKEGPLQIQNKFFRRDGSWDELLEKLEEYWNSKFPNDKPVKIIPWL